jgi:hypothetical protein
MDLLPLSDLGMADAEATVDLDDFSGAIPR